MASIEDFNAIFGSAPDLAYQQKTVEEIHKNRRQLENCLFFDRLLKAVGIDQGTAHFRLIAIYDG